MCSQLGNFPEALEAMAKIRDDLRTDPANYPVLIAHFQRAIEMSVSAMTMSAMSNIRVRRNEAKLPPVGAWVTATAPARIDMAGGWTDTPPICSDFGGNVAGVSITIDGKVRKNLLL